MEYAETFFKNYFFDYFPERRALFFSSEFPWYNLSIVQIKSRSKFIFQMLLITTLFSFILCNEAGGKNFTVT